MGKISGPLLDRIDLHIEVPSVPFQELAAHQDGTCSNTMREQVYRARETQKQRFASSAATTNARMTSRQLRSHCAVTPQSMKLLQTAMEDLGLSAAPTTAS